MEPDLAAAHDDGPVRVLAVDDEPAIREAYRKILVGRGTPEGHPLWLEGTGALFFEEVAWGPTHQGLELVLCDSGDGGVEAARLAVAAGRPFHVVFMDVRMPGGRDGIEAAEAIRAFDGRAQIVFVTAYMDQTPDDMVLRVPPVDRLFYLQKPFTAAEIRQFARSLSAKWRVERDLQAHQEGLERLVQQRTREVERSRLDIILRLAKAGEYRDEATGRHIVRVGEYTRVLAEALGMDAKFVRLVSLTSPLHDIGKIGVPDGILLKPGRLTPREFRTMQRHCRIGADILQNDPSGITNLLRHLSLEETEGADNPIIRMASSIALGHHERWDGQGYPGGIRGADIPIEARLTALADVYDALRSPRPYKEAFSHEQADALLAEGAGTQFDPDVFDAYRRKSTLFDELYRTLTA